MKKKICEIVPKKKNPPRYTHINSDVFKLERQAYQGIQNHNEDYTALDYELYFDLKGLNYELEQITTNNNNI